MAAAKTVTFFKTLREESGEEDMESEAMALDPASRSFTTSSASSSVTMASSESLDDGG